MFYDSDEGGGTLRIITGIAYNTKLRLWVACTHRANDDGPPAADSAYEEYGLTDADTTEMQDMISDAQSR